MLVRRLFWLIVIAALWGQVGCQPSVEDEKFGQVVYDELPVVPGVDEPYPVPPLVLEEEGESQPEPPETGEQSAGDPAAVNPAAEDVRQDSTAPGPPEPAPVPIPQRPPKLAPIVPPPEPSGEAAGEKAPVPESKTAQP